MLHKKGAKPILFTAVVALVLCGMSVFADYQEGGLADEQPQPDASGQAEQTQGDAPTPAESSQPIYLANDEQATQEPATDPAQPEDRKSVV